MNKIILATILSVILLTTPFASVSAQSPEKSDKSKKSESKAIPLSQLRTLLPLKTSDDLSFTLTEVKKADYPKSSGGYTQLVAETGLGRIIQIVTFDKGKITLADDLPQDLKGKTISGYKVTNTDGYCIERHDTFEGIEVAGYGCVLDNLSVKVYSLSDSNSKSMKNSRVFLDYVLDKYGKYYSKTVKVSYDKPISLNFDKAKPATSESKSKTSVKSKPVTK